MSVSLETLVLARKYVDDLILGGGGGVVKDYNLLSNKPRINDVELIGNVLSEDLDLVKEITDEDINNLF